MKILTIKSDNFEKYGDALVDMYLAVFSTDERFQYYHREDTEKYLQSIFEIGYGIIAIENELVLGAILLTPMTFDELLPDSISRNFNLAQSIYVCEMMVEKTHQGHGIGKKLLLHFLKNVDRDNYHDAFIRVWVENTAAVGLYKNMGFRICASIEQEKLLADKRSIYNFKKNYLHQTLNSDK